MIAIATIRLKETSTAAMLTVELRAVPRNCATAICRQAGPFGRSRANTTVDRLGVMKTAASSRQAIAA